MPDRTEYGVWALPNGEAIYRFDVKQMATTDMTPEQIHALGLSEVKRIKGEITPIAHAQGFNDLANLRASLKTNPKTHARSREDILMELRSYAKQELGDKFDIRAFHDEILDGRALSLDVLEAGVNNWIAAVKSGKAPAHPVATAG